MNADPQGILKNANDQNLLKSFGNSLLSKINHGNPNPLSLKSLGNAQA